MRGVIALRMRFSGTCSVRPPALVTMRYGFPW